MRRSAPFLALLSLPFLAFGSANGIAQTVNGTTPASVSNAGPSATRPGRDPGQPIDDEYTRKIREYTTEPFFLSPLIDYLPASATVPTPKAVLGDIAGAKDNLPYSKDVYAYMRLPP